MSISPPGSGVTRPTFLADNVRVVLSVCAVTVASHLLLDSGFRYGLAGRAMKRELPSFERTIALCAAAAGATAVMTKVVSCVLRAKIRPEGVPSISGTSIILLVVTSSFGCATSGMALLGTPAVADPMTGKVNYMCRWAQWIPLSFAMTFVVESIDAKDLRDALPIPAMQVLSTMCGAALPLAPNKPAWCVLCVAAFSCFLGIIPRSMHKRRRLRWLVEEAGDDAGLVHELKVAQAASDLHGWCAALWCLFVAVWLVDTAVTLANGQPHLRQTDWAFVADCCVDTFTKLFYMGGIAEVVDALPLLSANEQSALAREEIGLVWNTSNDIILISTRVGTRRRFSAETIASPSVRQLLPLEHAAAWMQGVRHELRSGQRSRRASGTSADQSSDGASSFPMAPDAEPASADLRAERVAAEPRSRGLPQAEQQEELQPRGEIPGPPGQEEGGTDEEPLQSEELRRLVERAWAGRNGQPVRFTHAITALAPRKETEALGTRAAQGGASPPREAGARTAEAAAGSEADGVEGGVRVCEVCASPMEPKEGGPEAMVVIVRDITDRLRAFSTEKALLALAVARQKDEEAVHFTRHELKNCVLASAAQCQELREHHAQGVRSGLVLSDEYGAQHRWLVDQVSAQLGRTLQIVLTDAMAREVVHGKYVAQLEPVDLRRSLQLGGAAPASAPAADPRFPFSSVPTALPSLYLDSRLVYFIYRNALSNAVKYGRPGGTVQTEAVHDGAETLTLRVINEPGPDHERLCALSEQQAQRLFEKGVRLHAATNGHATVSAGDGAWIAAECARCHGGRVRISLEPERTVFEATLRAQQVQLAAAAAGSLPLHRTHRLPERIWAIGIDDSAMQRAILESIFAAAGVRKERRTLLGRTAAEIEGATELILAAITAAPADAYVLLVSDECLDLPVASGIRSASGSAILARVQAELPAERYARVLAVVRSANYMHAAGAAGAAGAEAGTAVGGAAGLGEAGALGAGVQGRMGKDFVDRASALAALLPMFARRFGLSALEALPRAPPVAGSAGAAAGGAAGAGTAADGAAAAEEGAGTAADGSSAGSAKEDGADLSRSAESCAEELEQCVEWLDQHGSTGSPLQVWAHLKRAESDTSALPLGARAEMARRVRVVSAISALRTQQATSFETAWPALRADLLRLLHGEGERAPASAPAAKPPAEAPSSAPAAQAAAEAADEAPASSPVEPAAAALTGPLRRRLVGGKDANLSSDLGEAA